MRVLVLLLVSMPAFAARCRSEMSSDLPSKPLMDLALACAEKSGDAKEGARQKLPDGRIALWVVTGDEPSAPANVQTGLLALVRYDGKTAIVDAVGAWENGADAKRSLKPGAAGGSKFFLEPTGHSGTGGGYDSVGVAVWLERKGKLVRAGEFETEGNEENMGTSGPRWRMKWKASIAFEDSIHVTEKQTWSLVNAGRPETLKLAQERYFVFAGDKLEEQPAHDERKPPHAADAPGKRVTLTVDCGPGQMRLTFDTARITEEMVKPLVDFAPQSSLVSAVLIEGIEQCVDGQPEYKPCGKRDITAANFMENAAVNLKHDEALVQQLRARVVPAELEPAKEFVVRDASFRLEMEQRRYQFAKSGDVKIMEAPLTGPNGEPSGARRGASREAVPSGMPVTIEPAKVCAAAIEKLRAAADAYAKYRTAWYDWNNCVNHAFLDKQGEYSKLAWQAFLDAYGIRAKYLAPEGD